MLKHQQARYRLDQNPLTEISKMPPNLLKLNPAAYIIIVAATVIATSLMAAPTLSLSSNQCSSCHGSSYNQQLDILEGNSQNLLPSMLQVGQIATVKIAIENINNAPRYNQFTGVTVTLRSQNGHFSVNSPNFNIGTLTTGTAIATWQITGISQGSDALIVSASATNNHFFRLYTDNYTPNPTITIVEDPNSTPGPSASISPPTSTPTAAPTSQPTTNPTITPTTQPTPTAKKSPPTQTPNPTSTQLPSPDPTTQPSATPSSINNSQQVDPTDTNLQTNELNSSTLYLILAIASCIPIFALGILVLYRKRGENHLQNNSKLRNA
jgi:hypothetical protein